MKKMKKLLYFLIAVFAIGCSKEQTNLIPISSKEIVVNETLKAINYKGLTAYIPESFPENVVNLNSSDLEFISNQLSIKNSRISQNDNFYEVADKVIKGYPDIYNFDPKDYKKYFPKLSQNEIEKEQEMVLSFVESLIGYEIALEFSKSSRKNSKVAYEGNSCEKWYYALHARLNRDGIQTASDKAFEYAGRGGQDKSDANRHAVWNVYLGKYAAYRYSDVETVKSVVKGLTDAHECETTDAVDKQMDLHNNVVGLQYLGTIAERYKYGFLDYDVRVTKSDQDIFNYINALTTVIKTTVADIDAQSNTTLVKLK
jgi:hypothetical protein